MIGKGKDKFGEYTVYRAAKGTYRVYKNPKVKQTRLTGKGDKNITWKE